MVLEKTLESYLGSKEIKLVNPKGNQPWIFIGRTDAEVEAPLLCPSNVKSQLFWLSLEKTLMLGKTECRRRRRQRMRWMDGWHHWLNGHELEQTLADSEGQGSLVCCSPWALQRVGHDWATEQQQAAHGNYTIELQAERDLTGQSVLEGLKFKC